MAGFQYLLDLIRDGESVRAATPNRPLRQLDGNIRYLKDVLEEALLGQATFIREATIEIDAQVGQPVYFNTTRLQYERAIGSVDVDPLTGFLRTAPAANLAGIVYRKLSATQADILVSGLAEVDLSSAVSGDVTQTVYYLSNASAGGLTPVLPPTGMPVLQVLQEGTASGTWQVLLKSQFRDFLAEHRHFSTELVAYPAGKHDPPVVGARHVITNADSSQEGWLPADNAIFNGLAPTNAKFGYNLAASSLADIWPPLPITSVSITLMKIDVFADPASPTVQGVETLTSDYVVVNENGIWWMTDCYNEVPWPTTLNTSSEESTSISVSADTCSLSRSERLFINWVSSDFYTGQSAVLSLKGRDGSGLSVYCRNTDTVQEAGHLEIDFDLSLLLDSDTESGHLVFKSLSDGQLNRGPVVESIKSNSAYLGLTSDVTIGSDGKAYGNVIITANLDVTGSEFSIDTVRLNGTEEEFYKEVLAIGFPATRAADFRGRCDVPGQVELPAGTQLKLQFWILGRVTGTIPANVFTLTYRIVPRPSAALTPVALPTSDTALTINAGVAVNIDEYYLVESEAFDIAAGDEVLFTLGRAAPDSYNGELHILRMRGIPVAGS